MQTQSNWSKRHSAARICALIVAGLYITHMASAQGLSTQGLSTAATQVKGAFTVVSSLMYAICGIVGLITAITVFSKISNGDPDAKKAAAAWVGALIFIGLVVVTLTSVFGG